MMVLIGIPSGPVAFLGFKDLMILLISSTLASGNSKVWFLLWTSLILEMLGWFLYYFITLSMVSRSFSAREEFPKLSGAFPDDFSTIFM